MSKENQSYHHHRIAPPKRFEDVFSYFYAAENTSKKKLTKTFLPTYQTILMFNFGPPVLLQTLDKTEIKIEKCVVLGTIKKAFSYTLPAHSKIVVINFKADAFYRFFGKALVAENQLLHPDELVNENCFSVLWNQLNEIKNLEKQMKHILDFCTPYLTSQHRLTKNLVNFQNPILNLIKSIAEKENQSERNIQLHHKKVFGYSAKEINRYQRFIQALELSQQLALKHSTMDWFEVIERCGYYDQSQLIRDFNHFLQLSPTNYLKFQHEICFAQT